MPDSFKRYRFSVPIEDKSVTQWISAQANLSHSIRELIKTAIRCNGYSDVSCYPVQQLMVGGAGMPIEYALMAQAQGGAGIVPQSVVPSAPQPSGPVASPFPTPSAAPAQASGAPTPNPFPSQSAAVPPAAYPPQPTVSVPASVAQTEEQVFVDPSTFL